MVQKHVFQLPDPTPVPHEESLDDVDTKSGSQVVQSSSHNR